MTLDLRCSRPKPMTAAFWSLQLLYSQNCWLIKFLNPMVTYLLYLYAAKVHTVMGIFQISIITLSWSWALCWTDPLMLGFTTKITCLLEVHTFGLIIDLNIISQAHYKAQFKHVTFRWSVHRRQICFPIPIKWSLTLINLKILFSSALIFSCVSDTFDIWSRFNL